MTRYAFCFALLVSCFACGVSSAVRVSGAFQTGWWTDVEKPEYLAGYAADGNTLVLAYGSGWFTAPEQRAIITTYLDEAHKHNIKVILSMTRQRHTPYGIPVPEFIDTIAACKDHPALYAWYLGDEPELYDNNDGKRGDDWAVSHEYLASNPGFYRLAKSADPNHPVLISFNMLYIPYFVSYARVARFLDVTDLVGMHNYPFLTQHAEFAGRSARTQYDRWEYILKRTARDKKLGFIATAQGFGKNSHDKVYRDPTLAELRHQVFSAVALGANTILFWYDAWASPEMKSLVKRMIGQIQAVGSQMNSGTTNDPRIGVKGGDRDELIYRYGVSGGDHVILAVNISHRYRESGAALRNVRFVLPAGINPAQVAVLGEDRALPVSDGGFTDSFAPFAVHIYSFSRGPTARRP